MSVTRKAKSGRDWNSYDLAEYNISIVRQDAATFFGQATLPPPDHHPDLLSRLTADEMGDEESYQVVRYMDLTMDLAMDPVPAEGSAVVDFIMQLLRVMGYTGRASGGVLRSHKNIPLFNYGEWKDVKTDVCIMDTNGYLLLVQEDKRHLELVDPAS